MADFAEAMAFPIIPCNLCGSQKGLQRVLIKELLNEPERRHPGRRDVMFYAVQNVRLSPLVDDRHWDFEALARHA